jgi:hypothetical protein
MRKFTQARVNDTRYQFGNLLYQIDVDHNDCELVEEFLRLLDGEDHKKVDEIVQALNVNAFLIEHLDHLRFVDSDTEAGLLELLGSFERKENPLKWFIKGRNNGWIGPFDSKDLAVDFAWNHLEEAVRFWPKPEDFEGSDPSEFENGAFITLPNDLGRWMVLRVENGAFHHKCLHEGCDHIVIFDDEPACFKHSPDEGSSKPGFSARAFVLESGTKGLNYLPDWIEATK